jgi:hypothetical protein
MFFGFNFSGLRGLDYFAGLVLTYQIFRPATSLAKCYGSTEFRILIEVCENFSPRKILLKTGIFCFSFWTCMGGVKYDLRPVCVANIKFPWYGGQRQSFTIEGLLVQYTLWGEAILFFHQLEFRSRRGSSIESTCGERLTFSTCVSHSSIILRNTLRNSSSVTLRYT